MCFTWTYWSLRSFYTQFTFFSVFTSLISVCSDVEWSELRCSIISISGGYCDVYCDVKLSNPCFSWHRTSSQRVFLPWTRPTRQWVLSGKVLPITKLLIHKASDVNPFRGFWGMSCRFYTLFCKVTEEEWVQKHFIIQWVFPDIKSVFREGWNCCVCFLSAWCVYPAVERFDAVTLTSRGRQLQTCIYCSCCVCESDFIYSVNKMMQNCLVSV